MVIPFREEMAKRHLKVTGDLGRIVFMVREPRRFRALWVLTATLKEYDLRNTASLEESVRHSDIVFNLVGRNYPTKYENPLAHHHFAPLLFL